MNIEAVYVAWVVVALAMFRLFKPAVAVLASTLGGWILLPVGVYPAGAADVAFPYWIIGSALPSDMLVAKAWLAPASALLGVLAFDRDALRRLRPTPLDAPVAAWCLWPLVAALGADAPRPSALVASAYLVGCWGVPWLLGRMYFASRDGRSLLVKGLVASALACLPFSLIEGAFGPTLYGALYAPHPFRLDGATRYLGFRPIGFFEHGNQFGLWISLCALAALWLALAAPPGRRRLRAAAAALLVLMAVAAQSIGSLLLLAIGAGALWTCRQVRPRLLIVATSALLVSGGAIYVSGVVPIARLAKETSVGRDLVAGFRNFGRGSFTWRISQDQKLLAVATERPAVGTAQWDWWRDHGTRPWGLTLLVVGQFGVTGLLLVLATLLGPALAVAWTAPRASVWRPDGAPLVLAALALLSVGDALLNAFFFFPAIIGAGAIAAGAERRV